MCGRVLQTLPLNRLISIARARMAINPQAYNSSFNVCPTTFIPAIKTNKKFVASSHSQKPKSHTEAQQPSPSDKNHEESISIPILNEDEVESKKEFHEGEEGEDKYSLEFSPWGIKTQHHMIVNARSEEILCKPTFTKIIQNRCVVILEGYYEWNKKKEPYLFKSKTSDHLLAAAIFND